MLLRKEDIGARETTSISTILLKLKIKTGTKVELVGKERIAESTKQHLVKGVMRSYCDNGDR